MPEINFKKAVCSKHITG